MVVVYLEPTLLLIIVPLSLIFFFLLFTNTEITKAKQREMIHIATFLPFFLKKCNLSCLSKALEAR